MSGRAAIAATMARHNARGNKRYCLEEYAPFNSCEISAQQFTSNEEWHATVCQPMWYGAPEVITEKLWWMDDLSDWAARLAHH